MLDCFTPIYEARASDISVEQNGRLGDACNPLSSSVQAEKRAVTLLKRSYCSKPPAKGEILRPLFADGTSLISKLA